MWFDKRHPNALYIDKEERLKGCIEQRPEFEVKPDMLADFRALPFPDQSFKLVVWDPPHIRNLGRTSIMRKKFGSLEPATWQNDLAAGFRECWRVLKDDGVLIFKWNDADIKVSQVLDLFPVRPLFGHPTAKQGKTHWCCFMKIKEANL